MPSATAKRPTEYGFAFTGLPPIPGRCPGVDTHGRIHALPQLKLTASRADILAYFNNTWTLTEVVFSGLANEEAYYRRPYHQLRHPMIFYYGHPVSLYVNKLRVAGLLDGPVNAEMEKLFETGVDEMRWDDLHEGADHIWPSVAEVRAYRQQVYDIIVRLIETHPALDDARRPITIDDPMWALVMGFEHERIHLETSSVLIRELPLEYVRVPEAWPALVLEKTSRPTPHNPFIARAETTVEIGKPRDFPSFGWDNEYGHESRRVRSFSASQNLISNGEFLAFVKAGGYANEAYWSREGLGWRRFRNVKHPSFWLPTGPAGLHDYQLRTVFEVVPMPSDWPAIVNFHEAKAYAAWASARDAATMPYRLITEAEHHAMRDGSEVADAVPGNLHFTHGSETSVTHYPANAHGFHDVFGNAWQWCEDHFHPLAGGTPHPYYDDFSAPCYDGEHQMILGGSFASTGDEASRFARFHFRPHFSQHASFRLARSDDGNPASDAKRLNITSFIFKS
ncbi:MAG: 5-histidylcysteine sulfoxide synthase [Rickettsiales bacterium]